MARIWLIAIGAVFVFLHPAGAKDWWGVKLPDEPAQFIFGYGSLVNSASRDSTVGKKIHAIPVRVSAAFGYLRTWNDRSTSGFTALGLSTFLTAGPKEARAWTIKIGATAPQAAGVIHSDFQRGFIKAEVVSYDDLIAAGSLPAARAAGKSRIEGKEYVMRDGDVVEFRFNV